MQMEKIISNIVFTMNRPLQLEAYLESLYQHMPQEKIQTYILYKVDLFEEQYEELFKQFPACTVIREKNFHNDFLRILDGIKTNYILFATDDVVYFDAVDFELIEKSFEKYSENIFGFSLRLSPGTIQEDKDQIYQANDTGEKIYNLNWKKGKSLAARYPFELNSTVYKADLVRKIIADVARERPLLQRFFKKGSLFTRSLGLFISAKDFMVWIHTFHDPNTLEGYCYRWCKNHQSRVPDCLYFQKLCASAIQVNQVTTSVNNPTDGSNEHTVEALNEKYKLGYRFDIEAIKSTKPNDTHVGQEYFKLVKR